MKPGSIKMLRLLAAVVIIATTLTLISWDRKQQPEGFYQKQTNHDTIPQKRDKKIRDLDEAIAELEEIDLKEHLEKAMVQVQESLKQLDAKKIQLEIERSMKEVDVEKIKAQVDKAMKEVDFAKIEKEVKESIAKIDWDKMKAELDEVKKIDFSEMNAEMEKAKKEMEKIGPEIEKELKKAKVEIEKAKAEMKEYKSFVDGLNNDGMINKKEGYSLKHEDGRLMINDKEAPARTYEKYRSFLQKHPKFNIEKNKDDFNINMD